MKRSPGRLLYFNLDWQLLENSSRPSSAWFRPVTGAIQTYGPLIDCVSLCWFPYRGPDCQLRRWEALRVAVLLQQIWRIAWAVSSSPEHARTRRRRASLSRKFFARRRAILRAAYWICCFNLALMPSHLQRRRQLRPSCIVSRLFTAEDCYSFSVHIGLRKQTNSRKSGTLILTEFNVTHQLDRLLLFEQICIKNEGFYSTLSPLLYPFRSLFSIQDSVEQPVAI